MPFNGKHKNPFACLTHALRSRLTPTPPTPPTPLPPLSPAPPDPARPPHPGIEVVYPLIHHADRVEPFPTIYYLRDPDLVHRMSELERRLVTHRLQAQLDGDPGLMQRFHADHARYRDGRWAMLTAADRQRIEASDSLGRAFCSGIAGVANFDRIKCLHAHYAEHLARSDTGGTTVGRLIDHASAVLGDEGADGSVGPGDV